MEDFIDVMLRPFIACILLTGIHVYFGLYVIDRGLIFVDLAMAQIAALGSSLGVLLGFGLHSTLNYWFALGSTLIAAVFLSQINKKKNKIPTEAYIGVLYAVAAAITILILNFSPEGAEELKAKAIGHLLFVSWSEINSIFLLYISIGLIHWFLVRYSIKSQKNFPWSSKYLTFIFYATFGAVVSSSVEVGGVLLVFAILIVPSLCATLVKESFKDRLVFGWIFSVIVCSIGILCSYQQDLPTGATIVLAFGVSLVGYMQ